MEELVQAILQSYGIVGVILVAPFVVLKLLWSAYQKKDKELAAANEKIVAMQEKRVEDAKAIAEKLIEMSSEHASLTKETNLALDRVGDTLTILARTGLYQPRRLPSSSEEGDDPVEVRGSTRRG